MIFILDLMKLLTFPTCGHLKLDPRCNLGWNEGGAVRRTGGFTCNFDAKTTQVHKYRARLVWSSGSLTKFMNV